MFRGIAPRPSVKLGEPVDPPHPLVLAHAYANVRAKCVCVCTPVGEDTAAYPPSGKVDTSGSSEAGVHDAEPGLVMEANPAIPDAYRQELLTGQAEDTAWIVDRGGTVTVPYGTLKNVLTTLEATRLEPGSYDQKVYAPGIGIVRGQALTGPAEFANSSASTARHARVEGTRRGRLR